MVYFRTPLRKSIQETGPRECGVMSLMETPTKQTGRLGEDLAAEYLRLKNFQVRERNVRFWRFEIDIVAYDPQEKMIVFVEVKTRTLSDARYPVRTAVDRRKRRALQQGAYQWARHHNYDGPARIDLVCVAGQRVTEHLVNIGAEFF